LTQHISLLCLQFAHYSASDRQWFTAPASGLDFGITFGARAVYSRHVMPYSTCLICN